MKKEITSILFILTVTITFAQPKEYFSLVKKADSLYKAKDHLNSGLSYSSAFKANGWKGYLTDRYNAACAWALASKNDSAFFQLTRIATKANYTEYDQIIADKDLNSLHNDKRWTPLITKIKENKDKSEAGLDKKLVKLFDSLVTQDQKWRQLSTKFRNKQLGNDTISEKFILRSLRKTDSLNCFTLSKVFQTHGFPNYDLVGERGSSNFWLLIQHQDAHPKFQEEVLTKMKAEADRGKASLSDYAYLVDRVKVNTGQPQVYGTQMTLNSDQTSYEPRTLIEPEKINERRKSVGLDTIESYIQLMNSHYFGTLKKK
jgi:hypothetical protein